MWLDLDLRGARDPRGRPIGVSAGLPIRDPAMKRSMTVSVSVVSAILVLDFTVRRVSTRARAPWGNSDRFRAPRREVAVACPAHSSLEARSDPSQQAARARVASRRAPPSSFENAPRDARAALAPRVPPHASRLALGGSAGSRAPLTLESHPRAARRCPRLKPASRRPRRRPRPPRSRRTPRR